MTTKQESTIEAFRSGMNCAQVTLMAFEQELNIDPETALSISTGFGGGMGRLQETCGAVTGAYMVFGLYNSMFITDNSERKTATYEMIQEFSEKFKSIHGSITCKNLLNINLNTEEGMQEAREKDLFVNVCEKCILTSISLIEEQID